MPAMMSRTRVCAPKPIATPPAVRDTHGAHLHGCGLGDGRLARLGDLLAQPLSHLRIAEQLDQRAHLLWRRRCARPCAWRLGQDERCLGGSGSGVLRGSGDWRAAQAEERRAENDQNGAGSGGPSCPP